jgi:type II secretory pathway component PulF
MMKRVMMVLCVLLVVVAMVMVPVVAVAQGTPDTAAPTVAKGFGAVVWDFLNSAPGIAILAGVLLYVLNRLYAKRPLWEQFEGVIINAVKTAEKAIPDDTPNKAAARLDSALKLVIATYEEYQKRKATEAEVLALKNGISIVHDKLDAAGTL